MILGILAATNKPNIVNAWIAECAVKGIDSETFRTLAPQKAYMGQLDVRITSEILRCTGHDEPVDPYLGIQLRWEYNEMQKQGRIVSSRYLLWMIYMHYDSGDSSSAIYELLDLTRLELVQLPNMNEMEGLEGYIIRFAGILGNMEEKPTDHVILSIFYEQVRRHHKMGHVIDRYDYMSYDNPSRSYTWLRKQCRDLIDKARQRRHREEKFPQ